MTRLLETQQVRKQVVSPSFLKAGAYALPHGGRVIVPDGRHPDEAWADTEQISIVSHPDDGVLVGLRAIVESMRAERGIYTSVTVTDGAGGRPKEYGGVDQRELILLRQREEEECARRGNYASAVLLNYPSSEVKKYNASLIETLSEIVRACQKSRQIFTHSPLDYHPTHTAVLCQVVEALRALRQQDGMDIPVWGVPVWGGIDFLGPDSPDRKVFDVGEGLTLFQHLLNSYESQLLDHDYRFCAGYCQYLAQFDNPHKRAQHTAVVFVIDLLPWVQDPHMTHRQFVTDVLSRAFDNRSFGLLESNS